MISNLKKSIKVNSVTIDAVEPTEAEIKNFGQISVLKNTERATYIVKVRIEDAPDVLPNDFHLFVGSEEIKKFWGYKDGIYFKVYDPSFLKKASGNPIVVVLGDTRIDDSQNFPLFESDNCIKTKTNLGKGLIKRDSSVNN